MLLVTTCGQRSPKVLIISAVCGRAPPALLDPPPPGPPALTLPTSQDWLSLMKTRGLSAGSDLELFCAPVGPARVSNANAKVNDLSMGVPFNFDVRTFLGGRLDPVLCTRRGNCQMKSERWRSSNQTEKGSVRLPFLQNGRIRCQYFGTFGSTRSDHALIPPVRFRTFLKPDCCRNATALALRPPILQWTTISRLESSSLTRFGKSFSGIRYPPRLQI